MRVTSHEFHQGSTTFVLIRSVTTTIPHHLGFLDCRYPLASILWLASIRSRMQSPAPDKGQQAMEIIEYKTAVSTDIANLDKTVNELIKKGFRPFGTPYFVPKNAHGVVIDYTVCQAMVSTGESIKTAPAKQANVEAESEQVKMAQEAAKALDHQIAKALS